MAAPAARGVCAVDASAGDLAEVDFFEGSSTSTMPARKRGCFCCAGCTPAAISRGSTSRKDQVGFLDAHVRAFARFGGIPARIAFDNLQPAVVRVLVGGDRALTLRFAALASHTRSVSHSPNIDSLRESSVRIGSFLPAGREHRNTTGSAGRSLNSHFVSTCCLPRPSPCCSKPRRGSSDRHIPMQLVALQPESREAGSRSRDEARSGVCLLERLHGGPQDRAVYARDEFDSRQSARPE